MRLDPRMEFHRVVIRVEADGLKAHSTGGQRSSRMVSMSGANGLVVLPSLKETGPKNIQVGEYVDAVVTGEIQMGL
jgi:gephyrin